MADETPSKINKGGPSEHHQASSGGEKTSSETSSEDDIIKTSSDTSSGTSPERETPAKNGGDEEITEDTAASLDDVVQEEEEISDEKPLPRLKKEIPGYLYAKGSKQYDAAWLYAVDGIHDVKIISEKTGLTDKTVYNVRSAVRAIIDEVVGKKKKEVNPNEVPGEKVKVDDTKVGQVRSSDTKVVPGGVLVAGDIDASIYEKKPHLPTSSPHQTSSTSPNLTTSSGTSSETSPGTSPEQKPPVNDSKNQIVMHPYRFQDGRVMYYPTRLGDIEEQKEGKMSVTDLLKKAGYNPDETNPEDNLVDVEGTVLSPKRIDFTAHSLMI